MSLTNFAFVANLRDQTVETFDDVGFKPAAWLLSTHRLTPASAQLALAVRSEGVPLFADNGSKELIDQVVLRFAVRASRIERAVSRLRRRLSDGPRDVTASDVPRSLARRASTLARDVVEAVDELLDSRPTEDVLRNQLSMRPTHLIAQEDFATASLMALGLDREITGWPVRSFDQRNRGTLKLWEIVSSDPRCRRIRIYATLSATDYNTARSAGRLAAERGVTHVALGFAGINKDSRWVTSYLAGNHRRQLADPGPRRYVRTAAIARGIRDGFRDSGTALKAFHGLGLGTAPQFSTLLAAFDPSVSITIDATSPVLDAINDLVFYDPEKRGERITVTEGAERILQGGRWPFLCPFCRSIRARFGHKPGIARDFWKHEGRRQVSRADLDPAQPIGQALPVFATAAGSTAAPMTRSRVAHNHWVLNLLTDQVPSGRRRRRFALTEMDALVASDAMTVAAGVRAARNVLAELDASVSAVF